MKKLFLVLLLLPFLAMAQTGTQYFSKEKYDFGSNAKFVKKVTATSTTEGFHPCPSMTDAQMLAISSPANGDCVHNTTLNAWLVYNSSDLVWEEVGSGGMSTWITGEDYEVDDVIVGPDDRIYICLAGHTSGTFATDLATNWQQLGVDSTSTSVTDNSIVRMDGTSGKLVQTSGASVNDTGDVTANSFSAPNVATTSSFSGLQINNHQISASSGNNLDLNTTNGTINLKDKASFWGRKTHVSYNDPTSGSNATLEDHTSSHIRLTAAANLLSIDGIPAGNGGDLRTIVNLTGASVTINNDTGATAANRIMTGTGSNLKIKNNGSIQVQYDLTQQRWFIIGGVGGGSGLGGTDIMYVQDFEGAVPADFATLTGWTLNTTSPLHGDVDLKVTHAADTTTYSVKQTITVPAKFKGKNNTLKITAKSSSAADNLVLDLGCTTDTDLLNGDLIQFDSGTGGEESYHSFDLPSTCTNLSYTVRALPETGPPVTSIDDIEIKLTEVEVMSALVKDADSWMEATGSSVIAANGQYTWTLGPSKGSCISFDGTNNRFYARCDGNYDVTAWITPSSASGVVPQIQRVSTLSATTLFSRHAGNASTGGMVGIKGTFPMLSGDYIYLSNDNSGGGGSNRQFLMTYSGSLKQININKNSKIKIPTSVLRFENASGDGSLNNATWTSVAKISGDAFSHSSTDGTTVTMKKDGILCSSGGLVYASSGYAYVTKNQQTSSAASNEIMTIAGASTAGTNNFSNNVAGCFSVKINDQIRVYVGSGTVSPSSANVWELTHYETEVQVSVSNTLPQFSENDIYVSAAGNSGQSITADVTDIPFTTISDTTGGNWTGSSFTIPEDGKYKISTNVTFTSAADRGLLLFLNGSAYRRVSQSSGTSGSNNHHGEYEGDFLKGQVISIRANTTGGTLSNTSVSHYLNITKIGKPNVTGVDVTPFIDLSQIGSKGHIGEVIYSIDPVAPTNFISALGTTISMASGDAYKSLYSKIWSLAGISTTAGHPFVISSAKGSSADADWYAGKSITIDFATNELFIRSKGASRDAGSYQDSDNKSHQHITGIPTVNSNNAAQLYGTTPTSGTGTNHVISFAVQAPQSTPLTSFSGGTESRPKNVAMYAYIRYAGIEENALISTTQSFSTDSATLVHKTSNVTSSDPVGTFSTHSYGASNNTRSACATPPTQSTSSMSANGIHLTSRGAFTAATSCATPASVSIKVGAGFKGDSVGAYFSTGKGNPLAIQKTYAGTSEYGALIMYDEVNGILHIDVGLLVYGASGTLSGVGTDFINNTTRTSGYFVVNASKTPTLSGISFAAPRVAFLSDVKASGTVGGAAVATTWTTRTLNTEDDQSDLVTLSGNQFTLPAGEYIIEGDSSAHRVNGYKTRIRNVTDGTTAIVGGSNFSYASADNSEAKSRIAGRFSITSSKVFELQYYATTANASTNALGLLTGSGESEVYSQLKITKVK